MQEPRKPTGADLQLNGMPDPVDCHSRQAASIGPAGLRFMAAFWLLQIAGCLKHVRQLGHAVLNRPSKEATGPLRKLVACASTTKTTMNRYNM